MDLIPIAIRAFRSWSGTGKRYLRGRRYPGLLEQGVAVVRTGRRNTRNQTRRKMTSASRRIYRAISADAGGAPGFYCTYPISRKMFLISSRTFSRGWNAPPFGGIPSASKLYFLNVEVFHDPLPVYNQ